MRPDSTIPTSSTKSFNSLPIFLAGFGAGGKLHPMAACDRGANSVNSWANVRRIIRNGAHRGFAARAGES
jgi:hypothetical protein